MATQYSQAPLYGFAVAIARLPLAALCGKRRLAPPEAIEERLIRGLKKNNSLDMPREFLRIC